MTLSKEEMSHWICERLEPKPPDCSFVVDLPRPALSDGGLWFFEYTYESVHMVHREAKPKAYDSPEIVVRLLQHPGFVSLNLIQDKDVTFYEACFCGETEHSEDCGARMETATAPIMEDALAEAFMRANGREESK